MAAGNVSRYPNLSTARQGIRHVANSVAARGDAARYRPSSCRRQASRVILRTAADRSRTSATIDAQDPEQCVALNDKGRAWRCTQHQSRCGCAAFRSPMDIEA